MRAILFLAFVFLSGKGFPCSCYLPWSDNFYENVRQKTINGVVRLDSTFTDSSQFHPVPMGHFTLLESFNFTDKINGNTILMIGQDGANCAEWLYKFSIGDTLVVALAKSLGQYYIPWSFYGCGVHYLKLTDGRHNGLTINQIRTKIDSIIGAYVEPGMDVIEIYPNPVVDYLFIKNAPPYEITLTVMDAAGRVVHQQYLPIKAKIYLGYLPAGSYLIGLSNNQEHRTFMIIKVFDH